MTVDQRHIAAKVELESAHPRRRQAREPQELRRGGGDRRRDERDQHVHRQSHDVVIRSMHGPGAVSAAGRDARDPALLAVDRLDPRAGHELHAHGAEVLDPGANPHVAGGPIEDAIEAPPAREQIERELEERGRGGAGAPLLGAHRHERPGEGATIIDLVGSAAPIRLDELPPRDILELADATLVRAGEIDQEALQKEQRLRPGNAELAKVEERLQRSEEASRMSREARREDHRAPPRHGDLDLGRGDEVAEHAALLPAKGDARHRVREVPVEAGEEAKPVLPGQLAPATRARSRDTDAPRLAAGVGARLDHLDSEAALGELLRSAEAGDAAAEHEDTTLHERGCS